MEEEKKLVKIRFAIITVSDRCSAGKAEDKSGPRLCELAIGSRKYDGELASTTLIPDDFETIKEYLIRVSELADVVLTTGGTGFAPRDVTPEATQSVIDRRANGLEYALVQHSLKYTPFGALSRPCAGIRNKTLIVNLPGKLKAVEEMFEVLEPILAHAVLHLNDNVHLAHECKKD